MVLLTEKIKELIDLTDLFLIDIKHIDPDKCKKLVGYTNEKELNFVKYLSDLGKHMWIRQVLIPGITDNKQDLIRLKEFISTLNNVDKIEILPYHTLGKYKWIKLGLNYELEGIREATMEDVKHAEEILKK